MLVCAPVYGMTNTTTRHVILNEVKNLVAQEGCKTLRFAQGDIDRFRSDAVQYEVSL